MKEGKESPEDKLKTNLTSEFFATYDDLGKAKNRAEFEVDIKGKMAEKFGASQVSFGLDKKDIVKKAKRKENIGKAFYNLEEGNITQVLPNGEVATFSLTELGTYEAPDTETMKTVKSKRISPLPTEGKESIFDVYGADPFGTDTGA
jgi:hypothetical protein